MIYQAWLEDWLEHYVKPTVKPRTYAHYRALVHRHIAPHLGELALDGLTPYCLQCFVNAQAQAGNLRTGGGLSPNTVNTIINLLRSSLGTAQVLGLTETNPAEGIKRPRGREKTVECFTAAEQKRLEQAILGGARYRLYGVVLCLYTGLRLGELLALEWSDIDLETGTLRVCRSCHEGRDENGVFGRITDSPKTASSVRSIPIPTQLLPLLRGEKEKNRSRLVVSGGKKLISVRAYQRSFAHLLAELSIPHRGFHALRHTFATRALECGMDVKTLAEILGHKNATVTLNRYAHSLTEHKREMMNRIGRLL